MKTDRTGRGRELGARPKVAERGGVSACPCLRVCPEVPVCPEPRLEAGDRGPFGPRTIKIPEMYVLNTKENGSGLVEDSSRMFSASKT